MSDNVRLERIQVTKLFGRFNYDINLNNGEDVAILIAPNGCGKTTIFKLIRLASDPSINSFKTLRKMPFERFACTYSDGKIIEFEHSFQEMPLPEEGSEEWEEMMKKEAEAEYEIYKEEDMLTDFLIGESDEYEKYLIEQQNKSKSRGRGGKRWFGELSSFGYICVGGNKTFEISMPDGSKVSIDELLDEFSYIELEHIEDSYDNIDSLIRWFSEARNLVKKENRYPRNVNELMDEVHKVAKFDDNFLINYGKAIGEFVKLRNEIRKINVKSISANRVYETVNWFSEDGKEKTDTTLNAMQENLCKKKTTAEKRSNQLIKDALYRLPKMFIERNNDGKPTFAEFENGWKKYINDIAKLKEIGLLGRKGDLIDEINIKEAYDGSGEFLSIYLDAFKDTLKPYAALYDPLKKLKDIIDKRNRITGNKLKIGSNGLTLGGLDIESLSSGEKNDLIMFYELIFDTPRGSLVLIDEPEISWHIEWQEEFLDLLLDICKMNGLQAIVATHSPNIVNGHFELYAERNLTDERTGN